ncbi:MAG: hypothetical protein M1368_02260 [Thaumarchaeota archaeon]|nr:hypothetical protein [Nitrososphaerota archaeon]
MTSEVLVLESDDPSLELIVFVTVELLEVLLEVVVTESSAFDKQPK